MNSHRTAVIADGAEIGREVEIGPFCVIGPRVRIADHCRLHSHVVVDGDTWLGEGCEVYPFAVIGKVAQDKKLAGDADGGQLRIGPHNLIREHVTLHGGTPFGGGLTSIGEHNMFLAGSHVGHDSTVGSHVVFTNGAMIAGHTRIADRAILGAMVGVHQFARVGRLAMVGGGSKASRDVPPFAMTQGDRARLVGVNLIGLKRNGFTPEQVALVKRMFRLLFWRPGPLATRIERTRDELGDGPLVQEMLVFLADSRRGLCVPRSHSGGDVHSDAGRN
jgi:UDP-N-acetylglucosamine acyltransferase